MNPPLFANKAKSIPSKTFLFINSSYKLSPWMWAYESLNINDMIGLYLNAMKILFPVIEKDYRPPEQQVVGYFIFS
jgi:hypothetical protein